MMSQIFLANVLGYAKAISIDDAESAFCQITLLAETALDKRASRPSDDDTDLSVA